MTATTKHDLHRPKSGHEAKSYAQSRQNNGLIGWSKDTFTLTVSQMT